MLRGDAQRGVEEGPSYGAYFFVWLKVSEKDVDGSASSHESRVSVCGPEGGGKGSCYHNGALPVHVCDVQPPPS